MKMSLLYHRESGCPSPFDKCAIELSRNAHLRIACPYLTLGYLKRLISISVSWQLITDIEEWLSSVQLSERSNICKFMTQNLNRIRHIPNLHAKVLIGSTCAMIGSANFTTSGIQLRTEMAVLIEDQNCYLELSEWFNSQWDHGHVLPAEMLDDLVESLPPPVTPKSTIFEGIHPFHAKLITLDEDRDIRTYGGARGYYVGHRFCVLKGSKAERRIVKAFRNTNNGLYNSIRNNLISVGILSRAHEWEDYVFTKDHTFESSSAAACIVSGQSRSGPKEWGKR